MNYEIKEEFDDQNTAEFIKTENLKQEIEDPLDIQKLKLKKDGNKIKKNVYENVKNYKCDFCEKSFSKPNNLKIHIDSVHKKVRNHKCDMCDKTFFLKTGLKVHINTVHERLHWRDSNPQQPAMETNTFPPGHNSWYQTYIWIV